MSVRNKNDIRVYNESPFQINLVGQHREYSFPPSVNGQSTMNYVDWSDIEYANSRGEVFALGLLIFNEDEQEEIYKELHIRNWQDSVWFDRDIVDVLEKPTLDNMRRVINITNLLALERIRGKMVSYVNKNKDVSQKVVNVINARYRELTTGIAKSNIVLKSVDITPSVSQDEVENLRRQNEEMQRQMKEMQEMMAKVMNNQSSESNNETSAGANSTRKNSGRKSAESKK